jgi:hypothetical protein
MGFAAISTADRTLHFYPVYAQLYVLVTHGFHVLPFLCVTVQKQL